MYKPPIEMVRFQAEGDNAWLDALHYMPPRPTDRLLILIPGLSGQIMGSGRHDYRPMAAALADDDCAFLIPQLRSLDNWPFAYFDDVIKDIGGTVAFAKSIGYRRIALFGTSLGGPRIALYMASKGDTSIQAAGFIASIMSPYLEFQIRQSEAQKQRLDATLQRARDAIAAGSPLTPILHEHWFPNRHMMMAARSFISFFGTPEESNAVSIRYAPSIKVPTLVLHGTADEIALMPNAQAIYDSLTGAPKRDLVWVEGAKHYLTPGWISEAFARETAAWVKVNLGR
jgi:pimeloyl-ACP methyl ester carboxylesterase